MFPWYNGRNTIEVIGSEEDTLSDESTDPYEDHSFGEEQASNEDERPH